MECYRDIESAETYQFALEWTLGKFSMLVDASDNIEFRYNSHIIERLPLPPDNIIPLKYRVLPLPGDFPEYMTAIDKSAWNLMILFFSNLLRLHHADNKG